MVDPREVAQMARFKAILLGGDLPSNSDSTTYESKTTLTESSPTAAHNSSGVADMKNILRSFTSQVSDTMAESVARVKEKAPDDRTLREALMTSKTKTGVKIGSWEIKMNEDSGSKYYDVVNVYTQEAIATDLYLYESALSLTKLLNFHVGITSPKVKEILNLEERYSKAHQDAAVFRIRMKQRTAAKDFSRAAISEDRYQEARQEAISLREQLVSICKSL